MRAFSEDVNLYLMTRNRIHLEWVERNPLAERRHM